jgi:transcriptional regulator with XRE-family HTH domain
MSKDLGTLFRKQLARLRDSKGLSQVKLSEMIGAGQQYVGHVETGRIKTPPLKKMKKLFFIEGLDDSAEVLRSRIHALAEIDDVNQLRHFYRLMLVSLEKKSK